MSLWSNYFAFTRVTYYISYANKSHYAFQRGSTNMEVCHDNSFAWCTFTDVSFHFRTGPTSGSFALLVRVASRVRSLSLSVNLKSNYTRLRSQAVTQFVVIPGASIPATAWGWSYWKRWQLFANQPSAMQTDLQSCFSLYFISSGLYSRIFMCSY